MNIIWRVDDGFVNNGPHDLEIDDEELEWYETEEERSDFIAQAVQEDFEQKVTWYIDKIIE